MHSEGGMTAFEQFPEVIEAPVDPSELAGLDQRARLMGLTLHERCTASAPNGGLECGREAGHDGHHSISICNTGRVYVWPSDSHP